jgi:hypothetical protein
MGSGDPRRSRRSRSRGDRRVRPASTPSGGQLEPADSTGRGPGRLSTSTVSTRSTADRRRGREPGDTLQVDLLEFEPADWGWTRTSRGSGCWRPIRGSISRITKVPRPGERCRVPARRRVPIVPFCGDRDRAGRRPRSTIPPDLHGGNMDTRHLTAGLDALPAVFHQGARMSMGDGHAAQGDGEVCGTRSRRRCGRLVRLTCARTCT